MSEQTALATTASGVSMPGPLALIRASGRAESTVRLYTGVLVPYLASGGNLADVDGLRVYAESLPQSRRRHLRAAVSLWAKEVGQRLKVSDAPERHIATAAALNRLDALSTAIKVQESKGVKAHTWLSQRQVKELLSTCGDSLPGQRDRIILSLLLGAGLRRAELAALDRDAIYQKPMGDSDRMRTVIHVTGKGRKERDIPVSDRLAELLTLWASWTGKDGRIARSLGMSQDIGESLSEVGIFNIVRSHGEQIGLATLAPHDLRRTFAQIGYDAGVSITQISVLLGHANVATTQRYLNLELDLTVTASDFVPL